MAVANGELTGKDGNMSQEIRPIAPTVPFVILGISLVLAPAVLMVVLILRSLS